jgi:hypothetical protein
MLTDVGMVAELLWEANAAKQVLKTSIRAQKIESGL